MLTITLNVNIAKCPKIPETPLNSMLEKTFVKIRKSNTYAVAEVALTRLAITQSVNPSGTVPHSTATITNIMLILTIPRPADGPILDISLSTRLPLLRVSPSTLKPLNLPGMNKTTKITGTSKVKKIRQATP